ncbi:MAG: nitrous oxide reductase family maturation protein NosD [Hyphomicrobiales bacterium]
MRALLAAAVVWLGALGVAPGAATQAGAAAVEVAPGELPAALSRAAPGDTLRLRAGVHQGGFSIEKARLTLEGEPGAVVDGGGHGRVLWVKAEDVTIRHLSVRHSGVSLFDMDAGVFLDRSADRATVEDDAFEDNLIAVYVWGPRDATVRRNEIRGLTTLRRSERGSAIQLWNAPGARVVDNAIVSGRDGVFSTSSRQDIVRGNSFHDVRFAVHFMYTNDSDVSGNTSVGNDVGYVMMYSNGLRLTDNVSDHDRDHGLLFNYVNASEIVGNVVRGGKKCVFIYNANKNRFADNWFEGCDIGVHFTAGSERNEITGNAFIGNRKQVMYVGTRSLDWSVDGRGNYWSDNAAFDLNGDGIADEAYRPNDVIDQVVWRAPAAKLLLNSPAVHVVRWAQSQFPAIHPGGVIDSAPLMAPPHPAALARLEAER